MKKEIDQKMFELLVCLTEQELNKCNWGITLQEYLFLEKLKY